MADRGTILVVDDEEDMLENCTRILTKLGYEVITEQKPASALARVGRGHLDLILTDLRMPEMDGLELLRAIRRVDVEVPVILMTAFATIETAVEAIKEGAFDYVTKPFSAEQLRVVIERALAQRRLTEENERLREELGGATGFENIIGRSNSMLRVFDLVRKVAKSEASVLIIGESGTGKEVIARSIHGNSRRALAPFIPVDCASLPENLLESELFGHEKGAFTGAHASRPGLFEFAHGGTVFLDEIGDLTVNLQAKLLRVLQERQVRRVGGNRLVDVDVRVISATNKNLEEAVTKGGFREDLYFRLNVISIALPPLRERRGDVPLLVHHFLPRYAKESGKEVTGVSPEALELLEAYSWPGNVRELQNVLERAVVLSTGSTLRPKDLPEQIRRRGQGLPVTAAAPKGLPLKKAKEELAKSFEKEYLVELLEKHQGNISQAAKTAGVDRKTIHRLLKKHGITPH